MKNFLWIVALGVISIGFTVRAADSEEQRLIGVLNSSQSLADKDAACAKLKRIGTAQCVPAVAKLLTDENLSHSARYVLESMSAPEAEQALIESLDKTSGMVQVGIVQSLTVRKESAAVGALVKLLSSADTNVVRAASHALGTISGKQALVALQNASEAATAPNSEALTDGILTCAQRMLSLGQSAEALAAFERLHQNATSDSLRIAALRGVILASGDQAITRATDALTGNSGPDQIAALQLVHELKATSATKAFAAILPKLQPALQVALIGGLAQRDDQQATPAIAALAESPDVNVRIAAFNALGKIGDGSVVPILVKAAATGSEPERAMAREALVTIHRGDAAQALLAQLTSADSAGQISVVQALGERADITAVPKLLELARAGSDDARRSALQGLALLTPPAQMGSVVGLVAEATTDAARTDAAGALKLLCEHIQSHGGKLDIQSLLKAVHDGTAETRIALLPVCSGIIDPQIRTVLRESISTTEARQRTAAVRALADARDPELLPELLKIALEAPERNLRILATRGCVRLVAQQEPARVAETQRLGTLKSLLGAQPAANEKRMILSGLGGVQDIQALDLVMPAFDDSAVQAEAIRAAIQISQTVLAAHPKSVEAAMNKILTISTEDSVKQEANAVLKQLQSLIGFVTAWQISGPYRQEGKHFDALFDIPFPPEMGDQTGVTWQVMPVSNDPQRPWSMDISRCLGVTEQCVAYARTWIYSETAQAVRLEIGSDDGAQIWLNGKLIHANNVPRALQPAADKIDTTLNAGWNPVLFKVTQNNQGWEFCLRCAKPDGSPLNSVRAEASPQK